MKIRPAHFNREMILAMLTDMKSQTRRPMKPQPPEGTIRMYAEETPDFSAKTNRWYAEYLNKGRKWTDGALFRSPLGQPGDRFYARETVKLIATKNSQSPLLGGQMAKFKYLADGTETGWVLYPERLKPLWLGRCVPNGCYRELARIHREITGVRVERVQDITEDDALAEGIEEDLVIVNVKCYDNGPVEIMDTRYFYDGGDEEGYKCPVVAFESLYNSIYGTWEKNEWVWVYEYSRIRKEAHNA